MSAARVHLHAVDDGEEILLAQAEAADHARDALEARRRMRRR